MLNSISLHRKEAVFQNDNMTSPLLQKDVQTFFEVIDDGGTRVRLKIYKNVSCSKKTILCSPEHLNTNVLHQK